MHKFPFIRVVPIKQHSCSFVRSVEFPRTSVYPRKPKFDEVDEFTAGPLKTVKTNIYSYTPVQIGALLLYITLYATVAIHDSPRCVKCPGYRMIQSQ